MCPGCCQTAPAAARAAGAVRAANSVQRVRGPVSDVGPQQPQVSEDAQHAAELLDSGYGDVGPSAVAIQQDLHAVAVNAPVAERLVVLVVLVHGDQGGLGPVQRDPLAALKQILILPAAGPFEWMVRDGDGAYLQGRFGVRDRAEVPAERCRLTSDERELHAMEEGSCRPARGRAVPGEPVPVRI